ncbi:hypothetical protein EDC96DRAFT_266439 [Choanephora cucurbitarum]|nr:hypothetical protein EDC96DRAFT_266439 [Choanephora cucurbitarum]
MLTQSIISTALFASFVLAQNVTVPSNPAWLKEIDLSQVPDIPVRPVGSGVCQNATCDGTDNDRCFESCGNAASEEDIFGCPQKNQWALTFDDGPSLLTAKLLDILDQTDVKATFCVTGSQVKKYPEILRRAYLAGHQIASHTYSHPHLMSLTNEQIINEVKSTEEAIQHVLGIRPLYIRPPYGEADTRVKKLLKLMGYKLLLWNVDPTDYSVYQQKDASARIQGSFRLAIDGVDTGLNSHGDPGFISLQHDLYQASIDQVPEIIRTLRSKNFTLMTAAQCQNDLNPHYITDGSLKLQPANQTSSPPSDVATSSVAWTTNSAAPTASNTFIPPPVVVVKENIYKGASFDGEKSTSDAISSITKSALLALALSFASLLTL